MSFITQIDHAMKEYSESPYLVDREGARTLTYRQFNELSGKAAEKLRASGVKAGDVVIICMGRCSEYVAAEYGAVRIGAVAIPIIPSYPQARIEYITKDSGAKLVVKDDFFDDIDRYRFDAETAEIDFFNADEGRESEDPRRFMIYTSGSTGNPKGVVYRDEAVCAFFERCITETIRRLKPMEYAAAATMSFAVTMVEYYRNMLLGGRVHILSEELRSDIIRIQDYFEEHQITMAFLPPRMLKVYKNRDKALRLITTGTERLVNLYSDEFIITNGYGQTETCGGFCSFRIDKPYENTPVGKALPGIRIKIADADGNEVPAGEEGFIIAIGHLPYEYNNLPAESAKTFEKLEDGLIAVHTGDRGKFLPDGNLLFVNRNDWMLKVHGQRVEPGEIEAVMNKTEGVTASVVKGFELEDGSMLLCGFYTGDAEKEAILQTVESRLPHYMIPSAFVKLDRMPVNPNGKLDRMALKKPDLSSIQEAYEAPANEAEAKVCKAMEVLLRLEKVGRNDDFYKLGGNSINAVLLVAECDIKGLTAQHVMLGKTPKGIIEQYNATASALKPELIKADPKRREFPMTNAQKYQLDECEKIGCDTDMNDMRCFWLLDKEVDQKKLKAAVLAAFAESEGMNVSFDREKKLMYREDRKPEIREITMEPSELEAFHKEKVYVVRDLLKDELYELAILHCGAEDYLYININHLLYDESSLKNLISEIQARYDGIAVENEKTDIFDLAAYEESIKTSSYYKEAVDYYDAVYAGVTADNIPIKDEKQNKVSYKALAPELDRKTVEAFLQKNGVSEITYLQTAFALALSKTMLHTDELTYMVVYDGRIDPKYVDIKGVLARSIYMHAKLEKDKSIYDLLNEVQTTYQKMSYYDTIDVVALAEKYPNIKNNIYLNFRGSMDMDLILGGKCCKRKNIGMYYQYNENAQMWTRLNFLVDYTEDKHYFAVAGAGYNDKPMLDRIIDEFEAMLLKLIDAKYVKELG